MNQNCPKCGIAANEAATADEPEILHSGIDPATWQVECERAAFNFSELLELAGRRQTASAIIELLRTAPNTTSQIINLAGASLFSRCLKEASQDTTKGEETRFNAVINYLIDLGRMPKAKRAILEASIVGGFLGWGMGGNRP